jgi:hypothetical protein
MAHWLIILGGALLAGLVVLHGFGTAKAANELMLGTYRDMLTEAENSQTKADEDESDDIPRADPADEPTD